jgi:Ca2+-binding RTX toxin-like protein
LNSNLTVTNGVVGTISNAGVFGYNGQDQDLTYKLNSTGFSTSLFNHQFLSFSPSGNTVFNGGNANDSFLIDRIMLNTTLNGGAGNDAFSLGTTMATSNSSSIAFIDGNSGDNTLNAPVGQNNQFSLTSSGSGSLNTIPQTNFQNIQNIIGGIANDVITITRGMVYSSISGGGGYDTLQVQSDAGDTVNMNISGYNSGSISGTSGISIGAFSGFANLIGSAGNDTFGFVNNSGILNGTIDGGSGTNSISYVGSTKPVYVNLATGQATGVTSTTNTGVVSNIQDLFGGTGNDYFIGSSAANVMDGGSGDDTLMGQGGNDILVGNYGADQINGGAGYDILIGGLINFVTSGMPNATLQAGLQTIMTSWKAVANDSMFNSLSNTLNTASATQYRLVGDISNASTYMFQTVFNDQAVDRLTDIASSTVPNWFFATERVTSGNDIVLAGTTFTVSKKTVSSKSARSLR